MASLNNEQLEELLDQLEDLANARLAIYHSDSSKIEAYHESNGIDDAVEFVRLYIETVLQTINITWCVKDVKSVRSDLTIQQCSKVLQHLKKHHDATIGINWDIIKSACDTLFPQKGE